MDDRPSSSQKAKDQKKRSVYARHLSFLTDKGSGSVPNLKQKIKRASAPESNEYKTPKSVENGKDSLTNSNVLQIENQVSNSGRNHATKNLNDAENNEQGEKQTNLKPGKIERSAANDSKQKKKNVNNGNDENDEIEIVRANPSDINNTDLIDGIENDKELLLKESKNLIDQVDLKQNHLANVEVDILKTEGTEGKTGETEDGDAAYLELSTNDDKKKEETVARARSVLESKLHVAEGRRETGDVAKLVNRLSKKVPENKEQTELTTKGDEKGEEENMNAQPEGRVYKSEKIGNGIVKTKDAVTSTIEEGECPPLYLMQTISKAKETIKNSKDQGEKSKSIIQNKEENILIMSHSEEEGEAHREIEKSLLNGRSIDAIKNRRTLEEAKPNTKHSEALTTNGDQNEKKESRDTETTLPDDRIISNGRQMNVSEEVREGSIGIGESLLEIRPINSTENRSTLQETINEKLRRSTTDAETLTTNYLTNGDRNEGQETRDADTKLLEDHISNGRIMNDSGEKREGSKEMSEAQPIKTIANWKTLQETANEKLRKNTKDAETLTTNESRDEKNEGAYTALQEVNIESNGKKKKVQTTDSATATTQIEMERDQIADVERVDGKNKTEGSETILMKDEGIQSGNLEHSELLTSNDFKTMQKIKKDVITQTEQYKNENGSKEILIEKKTNTSPASFRPASQQTEEDHPIPGTSQGMATFYYSHQYRQPDYPRSEEIIRGNDIENNCSTYFLRVCERNTSTDRTKNDRFYGMTRNQDELYKENFWDTDNDNEPHSSNRKPVPHYSRERTKLPPQEMEFPKQFNGDKLQLKTSENESKYSDEHCYSSNVGCNSSISDKQDSLKNETGSRNLEGRFHDMHYSSRSTRDMDTLKRGLCKNQSYDFGHDECRTCEHIPKKIKDEIMARRTRRLVLDKEQETEYKNKFENLNKNANLYDADRHSPYLVRPIKKENSYSLECCSLCTTKQQQTGCSTQCVRCVKQYPAQNVKDTSNETKRRKSYETLSREMGFCQRISSSAGSEHNQNSYEKPEFAFQQQASENVEEVTEHSITKFLMEYLEGKIRYHLINRLKEYDIFNHFYQPSANPEVREGSATDLENDLPNTEDNRETLATPPVKSEMKTSSQHPVQIKRHNEIININNTDIGEINSSESQQTTKDIKIELEIRVQKPPVHKNARKQDIKKNESNLEENQEKTLARVTAFNNENLRRNSTGPQSEKIICPPINTRNDSNSEYESSHFTYTAAAASSVQTAKRKRIFTAYVKEQQIDNSEASTSEEDLRRYPSSCDDNCSEVPKDQCEEEFTSSPMPPPLPSSGLWICDEHVKDDTADEKEAKPLKKYSFKHLSPTHIKRVKRKNSKQIAKQA